jgi:glycerol-3-phosphate O-acyltransferase
LAAPEFFDKALFRGFIQKLRERHVVWTDDEGKLDYLPALEEMVGDARIILSREVRHSILKITPVGDGTPAAEVASGSVTPTSADSGVHEAGRAAAGKGRQ